MILDDLLTTDGEIDEMLTAAVRHHIYSYADGKTTKEQIEKEVLEALMGLKPKIARRAMSLKIRNAPLRTISIIDAIEAAKSCGEAGPTWA